MQLSARPLLDNAANYTLFVAREPILGKLEHSLKVGYNCLISGPPGSGKTSLVRALMFRLGHAGPAWQVAFVRANQAATAAEVLKLVLQGIGVSQQSQPLGTPEPMAMELIDRVIGQVELKNRTAGTTALIIVEDITATAGIGLFGGLRDELWQVDAQWLVTTSSSHAPGLRQPPADVFFETSVELAALTPDEGAELLRRRMTEQEFADLWDFVPAAALETPRRLLDVARELADAATVGGGRLNIGRGLDARNAALAAQSRPARMLAQELEALGEASASDERLLVRLGWTRPRVVQVMAELEQGGLVDMREESTGRGRPRKLYRLKPVSDFVDPTDPAPPSDPGSP